MLNVKNFGVHGDGVTDDTAALQAIINGFPNPGGEIELPEGQYGISASLVIPANTRILMVGHGRAQTQFVRLGGFAGATFTISGVLELRDLAAPDQNLIAVQTPPAVPASTVAQTNPFPFPCIVHVSAGTVTVIAVNASTTGLTAGSFILMPGDTITITYSVVPTWVWKGLGIT